MKRKRAVVEHRRNEIIEELRRNEQIKVEELAERWQVSSLTIRRDLQYLEEQHKIERFYGGATLVSQEKEPDIGDMYSRMISKYAAGLVEDGDTIFINASMTALHIVEYLEQKRVTVITNNGRIMDIEVPATVSVFLPGGELRYPRYAMVGEFALKNLEEVTVKKSFVGCSGLTAERGMSTEIMNEVHVDRLMIRQVTDAAYVLADHRKIGRDSSFVSQKTGEIRHLITDELAPEEQLERFRESGVRIYQVKKSQGMQI